MSVRFLVTRARKMMAAREKRAIELAIDRYSYNGSGVRIVPSPVTCPTRYMPPVDQNEDGAWVLARVFIPAADLPEYPK